MLISLSKDQKAFFEKEKYVEVEGVFTPSEMNTIKSLVLQKYTKETVESGHNLLLKTPKLKETFSFAKIGAVASHLLDYHPLRYVFDQLHLPATLDQSMSSIFTSSVLGLSLVCLLSLETGRCYFIKAERAFPKIEGEGVFWAIGLGGRNLQYVYNEKDSHTHDLKSSGYVFGDVLKQSTHPIIFS